MDVSHKLSMVGVRLRTVGEAVGLVSTTRWWLAPMFLLLGLLGLVLAGLQAVPYVAPFIYSVL